MQPQKKVYVQDILKENKTLLIEHIFERKGSVYICGNIGMSKAVEEVIVSIIMEKMSLNKEQAKQEIFNLKDKKRLCIEAWG